MAELRHHIDKWGNEEGVHYLEFDINGKTVQITVSDKHIHVIGHGMFRASRARAANSMEALPDGSPFENLWQYHCYVEYRGLYGEAEAMRMALLKKHLSMFEEMLHDHHG